MKDDDERKNHLLNDSNLDFNTWQQQLRDDQAKIQTKLGAGTLLVRRIGNQDMQGEGEEEMKGFDSPRKSGTFNQMNNTLDLNLKFEHEQDDVEFDAESGVLIDAEFDLNDSHEKFDKLFEELQIA